jgi:hypothetical protein
MIAKTLAQRSLLLFVVAAIMSSCEPVAKEENPAAGSSVESGDAFAVSLVDSWIDALGGMRPYWNLETARFTLTTEIYDPESGRLKRTRPRYVTIRRGEAGEWARIERWEGNDFIQQGFNGSEAWALMNGLLLPDSAKDRREVEYVSGDVNYWIALPFKLKDPGVFISYGGEDTEGRHDVQVTFGEGVGDHQDVWHYYFMDGQTWPVEVTYQEPTSRAPSRTVWEDITTVDGYTHVGRRVHLDADGRVWKVIRRHDVEINPTVPTEHFSLPQGVSPVE